MAEKTHSILGASSASRWLACPGSIKLSAGVKKFSTSYAEEGTAAHELAEFCLRKGSNAVDELGMVIAINGASYAVTEEMADAVQVFLDTVRADLAAAGKGSELHIEHKFHLDWLYDGLYGTNDAMVCQPFGTLQVYDYKHGMGVPVDVIDNAQVMYYGLGAAYGGTYEEVELVIVQPRANHPGGAVRRQRMPVEELMRWGQEVLLPGAQATAGAGASLIVGEQCRFCPALAICPKQKEKAMTVAKQVFGAAPTVLPAPDQLPQGELKKILDAASLVEAWFNACRIYARGLLETGAGDPERLGYKLVAGRSSRDWKNAEEAESWLTMLIDEAAYIPKKLVSPAQAEKVLKGAANKKALEGFIEKKAGAPQLAPVSDKRPAIVGGAAGVFTEVEIL